MARSKLDTAKDVASMAGNVAKTFLFAKEGSDPATRVDYGPGPSPKAKTAKPPSNYYSAYGGYAPRSPGGGKKVGKKKGRSKRVTSK